MNVVSPTQLPNRDTHCSQNMPVAMHVILGLGVGGMENILLKTTEKLTDFSHVVVVLKTVPIERLQQIPDSVCVVQLDKKEGNDISLWMKIYRLLRDTRASVLHTYNIATLEYQAVGFLAHVERRIHAEHGWDASDPLGKQRKYHFLRYLLKPAVHQWVVVSDDLRNWLINSVKISSKKITLIRNGIDVREYKEINDCTSGNSTDDSLIYFNQNAFYIGTVGRLDPVKNQQMLIDALWILKSSKNELADNLRVVIVGEGKHRNHLVSHIKERGLNEQIWLTGNRDDVTCILPKLDIFALTSIAEGIPLTILEAMAANVPVISTDVGGISEILDSSCGILVPANNAHALASAITDTLNNKNATQLRIRSAFGKVNSEFNQENMIEKYRALYHSRSGLT